VIYWEMSVLLKKKIRNFLPILAMVNPNTTKPRTPQKPEHPKRHTSLKNDLLDL
jgi:hypothetical protein